jgi:hypothetical protein
VPSLLNASSAVRVCALIVVLLPLLLLLTITILLLRCRLVGAGFLRLTLADLLIDLIDLPAEILRDLLKVARLVLVSGNQLVRGPQCLSNRAGVVAETGSTAAFRTVIQNQDEPPWKRAGRCKCRSHRRVCGAETRHLRRNRITGIGNGDRLSEYRDTLCESSPMNEPSVGTGMQAVDGRRAGEGSRTLNVRLGKPALCH